MFLSTSMHPPRRSSGGEGGDEGKSPVTCGVYFSSAKGASHLRVGVCVVRRRRRTSREDKKSWSIDVYEFDDADTFPNTEALMVRVAPSMGHFVNCERLCGASKKLKTILEETCCVAEGHSRKTFSSTDLKQDLKCLLGTDDGLAAYTKELALGAAMQALAGVLALEEYVSMDAYHGAFDLHERALGGFMKLDAAALRALNIFPAKDDFNRESSLWGVLNHCVTKKIGERELERWLRQPLIHPEDIKERQDCVEMLQDDFLRDTLRSCLRAVPDLDYLVRCFERGKANLEHIYKLYLFICGLPKLRDALVSAENAVLKSAGEKLDFLLDDSRFGGFSQLSESLIDLDMAPREFRVRVQHDDTGSLKEIAGQMQTVLEKVEDEKEQLMDSELDGMNAKFETDPRMLKIYGYHFRIAKRHDSDLKRVKGKQYQYLAVVNSGIKWSTSTLKRHHERYTALFSRYQSKQRNVVAEAAAVAKTYCPLFEMAASHLATLDALLSLAHAAAHAPIAYVKPHIGGNTVKLSQARHPCVELQEDVDFIANDVCLDKKFQIVTGPNMGGKSTYIRTTGIIAVMAQIGSYVPCSAAELPAFDAVLCRVGASDESLKGVSTFMAEMVEASAILNTATDKSLVVIDELGRGTSTYDGYGLAWAISAHLVKLGSYCFFATHFHELTKMASENEGVANTHVSALADGDAVTMLYRVDPGPCDQSYGINIARMAGFSEKTIAIAKRKVRELESYEAASKKAKIDRFMAAPVDKMDNKQVFAFFRDILNA